MDISLPDLGLGILAVTEGQVLKYCVLVKSVQSAGILEGRVWSLSGREVLDWWG